MHYNTRCPNVATQNQLHGYDLLCTLDIRESSELEISTMFHFRSAFVMLIISPRTLIVGYSLNKIIP